MYSIRTDWDVRPSPLYALLQEKRARGDEILDLTESNPTKCGLVHQAGTLFSSESLQRSTLYEPDPRGLPAARQAVADWYRRRNVAVDPARILLAASTSEAYSYLFRLLCNVGDAVAVPRPSYPLFSYLTQLNDVLIEYYRLAYDGEWHVDIESLDEALSSGAKALLLLHPNNPTGSFLKTEERDRIMDRVQVRRIPLIVDEVFNTFPFTHSKQWPTSFAGTQSALTFTINGLSKLVGLPQMKLAWIVVSGPDELCAEAMQRLEVIADTYLSASAIAQHSLPQILNNSSPMTDTIVRRVESNYAFLQSSTTPDSAATLLHCEGGWNAVIRLPGTMSDDAWSLELLGSHGVLVHPGSLFDFEIPSTIVISLLPRPDVFAEAVGKLISAVSH